MSDESKPPRTGLSGIASVIGGLLGALSRFRVLGREIRETGRDIREGERSIADELHLARPEKAEATEQVEHRPATPEEPAPIQPPAPDLPPGWNLPKPQKLPTPTYWPAVLAFGIVLVAWGPITHWYIALLGFVIAVIGVRGWIGELRYESKA